MSEPRRPEDGSTEASDQSWDQPSATRSDEPASSAFPTSEPTVVTSGEPAWVPTPPGSSDQGVPGLPGHEAVSAETTYQPAYTPAASADPAAYQQPGQAPYPAQYQQPPAAYPAPYQQPASGWGQASTGVAEAPEHAHSLGVALASVFLGFWGLAFTLLGILFLIGGAGIGSLIRNDPRLGSVDPAQVDQAFSALGVGAVILLLIGIPHLLAALGAPLHKGWARWMGVIVSVLGILLGVLILAGGSSSTVVNDQRVTVSAVGPALIVIVPYALALLALILSRRHFRNG